jgi:hypothetical protein
MTSKRALDALRTAPFPRCLLRKPESLLQVCDAHVLAPSVIGCRQLLVAKFAKSSVRMFLRHASGHIPFAEHRLFKFDQIVASRNVSTLSRAARRSTVSYAPGFYHCTR